MRTMEWQDEDDGDLSVDLYATVQRPSSGGIAIHFNSIYEVIIGDGNTRVMRTKRRIWSRSGAVWQDPGIGTERSPHVRVISMAISSSDQTRFAEILNLTTPSGQTMSILCLPLPPRFLKSPSLLTASKIGKTFMIDLEQKSSGQPY